MAKREYLGKTEKDILLYLADNPGQNVTKIQGGLDKPNHSAIEKAVKNLNKKRLVNKLGFYKAKGRKVAQWGLSKKGIGEAINLGADFYPIIDKYSKFYDEFKILYEVEKIMLEILPGWREEGVQVYRDIVDVICRLEEYSRRVQTAAALEVFSDWVKKNVSKKDLARVRSQIMKLQGIGKEKEKAFKMRPRLASHRTSV